MAYGTPSMGGGCEGCRSSINRNTGLGFSLTSLIRPVIHAAESFIPGGTIVGGIAEAGFDAATSGGDGSVSSPCPQPPLWAVAQVLSSMSAGELATLQRSLSNSDRPHASASNPGDVAYWVAGGKDCNTNASAHPDVAALATKIRNVIARSSIASGGSVYPIEGGPTIPAIMDGGGYAPAQYGPMIDRQGESTLDKILDALKKAGGAGVNAAVTSATGSAYGALPPAQQRIVQGQVAQSTFKQYEVPLMIGGGLVLAALALRGGRRSRG